VVVVVRGVFVLGGGLLVERAGAAVVAGAGDFAVTVRAVAVTDGAVAVTDGAVAVTAGVMAVVAGCRVVRVGVAVGVRGEVTG
jgi:hypothetical protein